MKLTPIKNTFIFKFQEAINSKGQFEKNVTETGIILQSSFDDSAKESRWVVVTEVGHECSDIRTGDEVLLPALRWTSGVKFGDETVWKSDEMQAVAKRDKYDSVVVPLRDAVIFKPYTEEEVVSSFGIVLVKDPEANSPKGVILAVGPDCIDARVGDMLFYDDANFFDTFTFNGEELAFIKEANILALG